MLKFIASHQDQISGVLSGFDRLVFRGTLRSIAYAAGMQHYLSSNEFCSRTSAHTSSRSASDSKLRRWPRR